VHFADLTIFGLTFSLSDNGSNSLRDGLRNIVAAIRLMTDYGDKQIPGSRSTAV
jgi:hypothetical protein